MGNRPGPPVRAGLRMNERTNEVYLPMNKRVDNDRLSVEAEAHQSWPL